MPLRFPESMDECVYFTRRSIGTDHSGSAVTWVYKEKCPVCKKELMGKPRKEDGGIAIRAKEYVCPSCNHTVEKKAYEETLTASIQYVCPACKNEGEVSTLFKRKNINGALTLRAQCEKCKGNIDITKKMKEPKKKGIKTTEDIPDDDE